MKKHSVTSPDMTPAEKRRVYQQRYKAKAGMQEKYNDLNRQWIAANRERYNEAKSEYRFKLKLAAITHYSNGTMACAHCGYSGNIDALVLDHIDDNGAAHRKELGCGGRGMSGGTTMYERLKALGWLPGLQVLCCNCNTIKEVTRKRGRDAAAMLETVKDKIRWRKEPGTVSLQTA
jgi:hypothetical protein